MARLNQEWKVEAEGVALAAELHRVLQVSHRQAKGILDACCVKVNGKEVRTHGHRLMAGDTVTVAFDPDTQYQPLSTPGKDLSESDVKILWEDKHLVFVDKPSGLLTVPTEASKPEDCLAETLSEHYRGRGFKKFKLFIVHRLDRYTSGVLVFAKTPEALHGLTDLFEEHRLQRVYKAILVGEIPENAGVLTDVLVERQKTLKMSVVDEKDRSARFGKRAVTHFRVIERLPGHTLVEIKLETGRRNQIRVQFAERGYPLLGDPVYGQASVLIRRQALHAELLGFRHPVTEDAVTVESSLPADMVAALASLRTKARVLRAEAGQTGAEGIYQPRASKEKRQGEIQRARRFENEDAGSRPSRFQKPEGDRPARPRREEGDRPRRDDDRPRPRFQKADGDRPARPRQDGDSRPPRRDDDRPRPRFQKADGDRPARPRRDEDSRPPRRDDDRPRPRFQKADGDRPARPRQDGDSRPPRRDDDRPRPRFQKADGDRPARPRQDGDSRPPRRDDDRPKPRFQKAEGDRPARPRRDGDKPKGAFTHRKGTGKKPGGR